MLAALRNAGRATGLLLLWMLHPLPLRAVARIGACLGIASRLLDRRRRRIVAANLAACFPERAPARRQELLVAHFRAWGRSIVDLSVLWWGSTDRIRRLVRVEGLEHLRTAAGGPLIVFAPHVVGLEHGGTRLGLELRLAFRFETTGSAWLDRLVLERRTRFGTVSGFPRGSDPREMLGCMERGMALHLSPDLDLGGSRARPVAFFGVPAATDDLLPRLARITGAVVVPCVTVQLGPDEGYRVVLEPAWEGFPSGDPAADLARLNAFVERVVREHPAQYGWRHRRFQTRPPGSVPVYEAGPGERVVARSQ